MVVKVEVLLELLKIGARGDELGGLGSHVELIQPGPDEMTACTS
jgi:hypothetical protein